MDIRISTVEATYVEGEHSKAIGPGMPVDLDEVLSPGVRVRDVFLETFFESAPSPVHPSEE